MRAHQCYPKGAGKLQGSRFAVYLSHNDAELSVRSPPHHVTHRLHVDISLAREQKQLGRVKGMGCPVSDHNFTSKEVNF